MADFVVERHSTVMERLRRRIELFRRHHNGCESRYEATAAERLEKERQQTLALHQRCLQTKAKRSSKHRQPPQTQQQPPQTQPSAEPPALRGREAELTDTGGGEQSRNSTLIALQETVKRKLESAGSPHQLNGFSEAYPPPPKKPCPEDTPLSPLDSKHGICPEAKPEPLPEPDLRLKELKQEPVDDILPGIMPSAHSGSSLFPDLNLDDQDWSEIMEEFNRSVPYEDLQELFSDGFEERKEAEPAPHAFLPGVKSEFSPAPCPSPALKDLSPAQQLKQLAAREQQRANQKAPPAKYHQPPSWPQNASAPAGSPSLYPQAKSLLLSKGSPKAGTPAGYMQSAGHALPHPATPVGPLGHPPNPAQAAMLDYSNTKPLTHYEAGAPGGPRGPAQSQSKANQSVLNMMRQQQMQKQRPGAMSFRPAHLQHAAQQQQQQEAAAYTNHAPSSSSSSSMSHSSAAYMKQQQQQQQQMQFLQRQMMAEQEKQRQQQEQQMQRHLTRPPPQYQDQQNQQNPFQTAPQQQHPCLAQQHPASFSDHASGTPQPIGSQRMFPQTAGMMGMSSAQADLTLPSCANSLDVQQVLYRNMPMHHAHSSQQRVPVASMPAPYRQQQLKTPPMIKQLARLPNGHAHVPGTWQHQGLQQGGASANGGMSSFPGAAFRLPKLFPSAGMSRAQMISPAQQVAPPPPNQQVLPELTFSQTQPAPARANPALQCGQAYQLSRSAVPTNQQQQQQQFSYCGQSGGSIFPGDSELDSLLKNQSTQEWMDDLDELLASHQST